jgi:predicted nucleic acid-binding protein
MARLFLDANVLFSAALSSTGTARALYQLAEADLCELLTSQYVHSEARRNLELKYPTSVDDLSRLVGSTRVVPEPSMARIALAERFVPAKDAPILAAARTSQATGLVTGDRPHFGLLYGKNLGGVTVLTPRQALEQVLLATERIGRPRARP